MILENNSGSSDTVDTSPVNNMAANGTSSSSSAATNLGRHILPDGPGIVGGRRVAQAGEYVLLRDLEGQTKIFQLKDGRGEKIKFLKYPAISTHQFIGQPYGLTYRYNALTDEWERKKRFVLGYGDLVEAQGEDGEDDSDDEEGEK